MRHGSLNSPTSRMGHVVLLRNVTVNAPLQPTFNIIDSGGGMHLPITASPPILQVSSQDLANSYQGSSHRFDGNAIVVR